MQLKSFHFSVGDSNTGPIGMCLRVRAPTPEHAVILANEQLAEYSEFEFPEFSLTDGVVCCNIYFNPSGGLTIADIDEEDEILMYNPEEQRARILKYSNPVIRARFFSDDLRVDYRFDANRWFQDASDIEVQALSAAGWGTHECADQIAYFMESRDLSIEKGLDYVRLANIGFEIEVDEDDAKQWLALHRPNLLIIKE